MKINGIPVIGQGTLVFYPDKPHSAIVKYVTDDNKVILIEQNWKWRQNDIEKAPYEREISIFESGVKFYNLVVTL